MSPDAPLNHVREQTRRNVNATVEALMSVRRESRDSLAAVLGISRNSVWRRLAGQSEWTVSELAVLAAHFGLPAQTFMDGPVALFGSGRRVSDFRPSTIALAG